MVHSEGRVIVEKKLTVVIPAYCEERLLGTAVERVPEWVDEVIVVDDGSTDATWEIASDLARRRRDVHAVRLAFNEGVGRAICRGYRRALELGADVVAVMAADAQMDPDDLRAVVEPVLQGDADYVKGNRLDHPDVAAMPVVRRIGTSVLASLTALVSGYSDLRDSQCGYTAVTSSLLRKLPLSEVFPSYGYPNDMLIRVGEKGGRLSQPEVRPIYDSEESGLDPLRVALPIMGILVRGAMRRVERRSSVPR